MILSKFLLKPSRLTIKSQHKPEFTTSIVIELDLDYKPKILVDRQVKLKEKLWAILYGLVPWLDLIQLR